jgi:hypothetical protein
MIGGDQSENVPRFWTKTVSHVRNHAEHPLKVEYYNGDVDNTDGIQLDNRSVAQLRDAGFSSTSCHVSTIENMTIGTETWIAPRSRGLYLEGEYREKLEHRVSHSSYSESLPSKMRASILLSALTVPTALAFPWLKPEGLHALLSHPEAQAEIRRRLESRDALQEEPRQLGTGLVPGVVDLLGGTVKATLDSVLGLIPTSDSVKGLKKFPEGMWLILRH